MLPHWCLMQLAFKCQVLHDSYSIHWKMKFYQEPLVLLKLYENKTLPIKGFLWS